MTYRYFSIINRNISAKGITLIELIVTLSIISILTASAAPSFSSLLRENQLNIQSTKLSRALHYARSQALTLGQAVLVCPLDSALSCATRNTKTWTSGWLVALDQNHNRIFDPQSDVILRLFQNEMKNIQIISNRKAVAVFSPDGDASGSNRTFQLCHKSDNLVGRKIVLSNSGRNRLIAFNSQTTSEGCAL